MPDRRCGSTDGGGPDLGPPPPRRLRSSASTGASLRATPNRRRGKPIAEPLSRSVVAIGTVDVLAALAGVAVVWALVVVRRARRRRDAAPDDPRRPDPAPDDPTRR